MFVGWLFGEEAGSAHLPVIRSHLVHQHVHVLRAPLPVLTAEVLQQVDGLVQTIKDAHHPKGGKNRAAVINLNEDEHFLVEKDGSRYLLWLLSTETEEEIVDEGGELVADQNPVLIDQVVGSDVGVGPSESLVQRVPLKGRYHMVLCKKN